jgi:ribosome recycling factor
MVARTKELAEEMKVAVRNVRRDANKDTEQGKKDKELTEDECDQTQEEIQKLTKKFEDRANELAKAKEAEVMEE